ncbi:MAG: transcriptional repressor [Candidatus Margulisiibacteriota bacterium]
MKSDEKAAFIKYLKDRGFKKTPQRQIILDKFLEMKGHVSADELFRALRRKYPHLGQSTVFRSIKLLQDAKIASEVNFTGKRRRFEPEHIKGHHDHLVCVNCGKTAEVLDQRIEKLQDDLVRRYRFTPLRHRLEIFGICRKCAS